MSVSLLNLVWKAVVLSVERDGTLNRLPIICNKNKNLQFLNRVINNVELMALGGLLGCCEGSFMLRLFAWYGGGIFYLETFWMLLPYTLSLFGV